MTNEEKLSAYIIQDLVERSGYKIEEIKGINRFLKYFDEEQLKPLVLQLEIDLEDEDDD